MGMTRDEALKVWLPVIQMGVETMPECKEALDMAIADEKKIDQVIRDYEKLCDFMLEQGLDGVACTKKVDEFCIETMRGLLGEYYAEKTGYGTDEKTSN